MDIFSVLGPQLLGIVVIGLFTFIASYVVWLLIDATMGIRCSEEDEIKGLDLAELGMESYPDFSTSK